MEFKPENVYYALNADESLIGAKGYFAQSIDDLRYFVVENCGKINEVISLDNDFMVQAYDNYNFFYLVEPAPTKPKYRPFRDCNELIKCYRDNCYKKQMSPNPNNFINEWIELPTIWVQDNKNKLAHSITDYDLGMNSPNCIKINGDWEDLEFLFKYCSFLDGSVCGVEE